MLEPVDGALTIVIVVPETEKSVVYLCANPFIKTITALFE